MSAASWQGYRTTSCPKKPQLAGHLLQRAHDQGIRAAFVAGDEVYGGRDLRQGIRERGTGYVLAVRSNYMVTLPSRRGVTVKNAVGLVKPGKRRVRPRTLDGLCPQHIGLRGVEPVGVDDSLGEHRAECSPAVLEVSDHPVGHPDFPGRFPLRPSSAVAGGGEHPGQLGSDVVAGGCLPRTMAFREIAAHG